MRRTVHVLVLLLILVSLLLAVPARAADRGAWAPNTAYAIGDTVTYSGVTYKCIQAHTSQIGWEPPNVPALWSVVSVTNTPGSATNTPVRTATRTNTPGGPTATRTRTATTGGGAGCWAAWVSTTVYNGGAQVSRNSQNYQAAYWTQGDDPATHSGPAGSGQPWIPMGACGGGGGGATNTPTRTNTPGGPTATRTRTPTRTSTNLPPPPPGSKIFAPYIDVSPGSGSPIMQLANNGSGNKHYTLAFILGYGCKASWFGAYPLDTAEAAAIGTRINELRAAGGDVIISFGGAAAPELANVCSDASSLAAQYQAVVNMYHPYAIDLDIEDFNPTAIDLRNKALKLVTSTRIHYTLGVLTSGFTQAQMDVLNNARTNGTRVDLVNIMAMDYYQSITDMGQAAISAAQASRSWLNGNGFSGAQLGITPMIGTNDSHETFSLANAQTLVSWANNNGITLLAFWSVGRDNGGCPNGSVSPSCSGVAQSNFQFSSIFHGFAP
jgi:chitodextrinase